MLSSLITAPRHVVDVYPAVKRVMPDGGGGITWLDTPVRVVGNVQPLASDNLNRTASTRDEYYGETLATTAVITSPPGTWARVRASLPVEAQAGFPVDALVVFRPGKYIWVDGAAAPGGEDTIVYQINAREVLFRMGRRTQHDKVALYHGNDVAYEFLEGRL